MPEELDNVDREEIARLVREGFTSGNLDNEDGKHIYWELKTNIWKDE